MNIKQGMKVRISTNLSKTDKRYGVSPAMVEMQGNVYEVKYECENLVEIYDSKNNRAWSFSAHDIQPVTKTLPAAPVMFDPKNL